MPPYRADLFAGRGLGTLDAVEDALIELEGSLYQKNIPNVLEYALGEQAGQAQAVLAAAVSRIPRDAIDPWIASFPLNIEDYPNSLHSQVINALSGFVVFRIDRTADHEQFTLAHRMVETFNASSDDLIELCKQARIVTRNNSTASPSSPTWAKMSQKAKRNSRRMSTSVKVASRGIDTINWAALGVDPPDTIEVAESVVDYILGSLKTTLEHYVSILQSQAQSEYLKRQLIVESEPDEVVSKPAVVLEPEDTTIHHGPVSAFPQVRPMKAALYFDSPKGFGPWTITMGETATKFLRTMRSKDKETLRIIIGKMKDLSTGHFSSDNQKRLKGPSADVPVFEAKATGDLRVVYHIDLIPLDRGDGETQVIKIFGIYTHAQMDHRMWEAISSQLGRKGTEYCKRSGRRERSSVHANRDMFEPAVFTDSSEEVMSPVIEPRLPIQSKTDAERVQSRLTVEKTVSFSQPLLNAILADIDTTLPHLVSHQEQEIIESTASCYVIGRSGTGKTTTMLFKMLLVEQTHPDDQPRPRQVFITKSHILAKKVQEYFNSLTESLSLASMTLPELKARVQVPEWDQFAEDEMLFELADDRSDTRQDLPGRFSELNDEHFPLFLTYDKLCTLIEGDIVAMAGKSVIRAGGTKKMISFKDSASEAFLAKYWPRFSETRSNKLDAGLVFSEILGVIKGSEECLSEDNRCLSRAQYMNLAEGRASTLAERAEDIYSMFEAYQRMKAQNQAFDVADRTHDIIRFFADFGVPGTPFDRLYVDEVQDNLLIDTMVLRALCSSSFGLFWAGDTAQTISEGSSFRFDDLKAFQHRLEMRRRADLLDHGASCRPQLFTLAVNYRSHAGIVNCARSVVDLIHTFWPNSIDKLAPEVGLSDGLKPVFFDNQDPEQLDHFIFGVAGSEIQFGAQQCIIVRNREAQDRLRQQVGDVGMILTIYESKGLEFNDVLLYDFFADSSVSNWRVVLNAIKDWCGEPLPTFAGEKHASICSELKSLYVALTRARNKVWIADATGVGEPMRQYWTILNLIENFKYTPGISVPQLADSSSSDNEWKKQGETMLLRKNYYNAKICFTRAKLPAMAALANAYNMRQQAWEIPESPPSRLQDRLQALRAAGTAFLGCANDPRGKNHRRSFNIAAQCFEDGGDTIGAARAYRSAGEFDKSVTLFRDLKEFDDAVEIVEAHREEMQIELVESVYKRARLEYFQTEAIDKGLRLFKSTELALEYLDERGLDVARATVLEARGDVSEAAELHYSEGRREQAISLLLSANDSGAVQKGIKYLIDELWRYYSFSITASTLLEDEKTQELLHLARTVDYAKAAKGDAYKLAMFLAIASPSVVRGNLLGMGRRFLHDGDRACALLCLDHLFSEPPESSDSWLYMIIENMSSFLLYADNLSKVAWQANPADDPSLARLFDFARVSENTIVLRRGTFLHDSYYEHSGTDIDLTIDQFERHFRRTLVTRLGEKGREIDSVYSRSAAFNPCIAHAVFRKCRHESCPRAHLEAADLNSDLYNQRVRVQFLRMRIFQTLRQAESTAISTKLMIIELYEILFPPHPALGSFSMLDLRFPDAEGALTLLRSWIESTFYLQRFHPTVAFVTDVLRMGTLAHTFDRSRVLPQADSYINRAPFWTTQDPSGLIGCAVTLFESMSGQQIEDSARAMAYMLNRRVPIDIDVLCDFVDHICSCLVLFNPALPPNDFNSITLPKAWLVKFFSMGTGRFNRDMKLRHTHFNGFLLCLGQVLTQLFVGSGWCEGGRGEYLLYRDLNVADPRVGPLTRNLYILRIIRAMCLLGSNMPKFRATVSTNIFTLSQLYGHIPRLYQGFVTAASSSDWKFLERALDESYESDPFDTLVQLRRRKYLGTQTRLDARRHLVYTSPKDILALLGGRPNPLGESDAVERDEVAEAMGMAGPTGQIELPAENDDSDDEDAEMVVVNPHVAPSEEEQKAAEVLVRVWRSYLRRRGQITHVGIEGTRRQIFTSYRNIDMADRSYRMLALGPLVHVIVCLDIVKTEVPLRKKEVKKLAAEASSEEMDMMEEMLTQTQRISKAVNMLHAKLKPSSPIHQACPQEHLLKLVEDAIEVLLQVPCTFAALEKMAEDLLLARSAFFGRPPSVLQSLAAE
ncbi:hypothetical protein CYLTODRAFT_449643 [Cylindrobasidium torrendii FP15055 ss-10]|uniref:UvrD-like helicase ATP-binding domain-containing protein n=1 Tax=Cylindrobasidium torrendii FP15055 ss-10 TaxID=1314674 RepID=A0A0D7BRA5_9AGAR|nr:hypothetical protein CYLTODRAFT_449643 [Cylindrobasidium torrendii FP15055 ss-10]